MAQVTVHIHEDNETRGEILSKTQPSYQLCLQLTNLLQREKSWYI